MRFHKLFVLHAALHTWYKHASILAALRKLHPSVPLADAAAAADIEAEPHAAGHVSTRGSSAAAAASTRGSSAAAAAGKVCGRRAATVQSIGGLDPAVVQQKAQQLLQRLASRSAAQEQQQAAGETSAQNSSTTTAVQVHQATLGPQSHPAVQKKLLQSVGAKTSMLAVRSTSSTVHSHQQQQQQQEPSQEPSPQLQQQVTPTVPAAEAAAVSDAPSCQQQAAGGATAMVHDAILPAGVVSSSSPEGVGQHPWPIEQQQDDQRSATQANTATTGQVIDSNSSMQHQDSTGAHEEQLQLAHTLAAQDQEDCMSLPRLALQQQEDSKLPTQPQQAQPAQELMPADAASTCQLQLETDSGNRSQQQLPPGDPSLLSQQQVEVEAVEVTGAQEQPEAASSTPAAAKEPTQQQGSPRKHQRRCPATVLKHTHGTRASQSGPCDNGLQDETQQQQQQQWPMERQRLQQQIRQLQAEEQRRHRQQQQLEQQLQALLDQQQSQLAEVHATRGLVGRVGLKPWLSLMRLRAQQGQLAVRLYQWHLLTTALGGMKHALMCR